MANLTVIKADRIVAKDDLIISAGYSFEEDADYIGGPLVDRLHEFEELGLEPDDIRALMNKIDELQDEKAMRRLEDTAHYGMTMDERAERKMIDDILDRIATSKNLSLSIFIGKEGTNITVYPHPEEDIPDIEQLNREKSCDQCCYNCEPSVCRRCHYKSHFERYGTE